MGEVKMNDEIRSPFQGSQQEAKTSLGDLELPIAAYRDKLAFFGAGRLLQQMEFHLLQALALFDDKYWLAKRVAQLEINEAEAPIKELRRLLARSAKSEYRSAGELKEKLLTVVNRLPNRLGRRKRLRAELVSEWSAVLPDEPIEELLEQSDLEIDFDEYSSVTFKQNDTDSWVYSRIGGMKQAILENALPAEKLFLVAGLAFESGVCRSDIASLMTPASDCLRWSRVHPPTATALSDASLFRQSDPQGSSPTLEEGLAIRQLLCRLGMRLPRKVGELRPDADWELLMDDVLRNLGVMTTEIERYCETRDRASQEAFHDFLRAAHYQTTTQFKTPEISGANQQWPLELTYFEHGCLDRKHPDGTTSSCSVPFGKSRQMLAALVNSGEHGLTSEQMMDAWRDGDPERENDRQSFYQSVRRLRKQLAAEMNLTLTHANGGKRYRIVINS